MRSHCVANLAKHLLQIRTLPVASQQSGAAVASSGRRHGKCMACELMPSALVGTHSASVRETALAQTGHLMVPSAGGGGGGGGATRADACCCCPGVGVRDVVTQASLPLEQGL